MRSIERRPDAAVRFSILGPLRAWRSGAELELGPRQLRLMLAMMLAQAGRPVPVSDLIDMIWELSPPSTATNVVHRHVGTLRRLIEPGLPSRAPGQWLVRQGTGYRMNVDAETLDLLHFRELVADARRKAEGGRDEEAPQLYQAALELWQGRCAADLEPVSGTHPVFTALEDEYSMVAREAAAAARRHHQAAAVLPGLRRAAERNPLDEALRAQLMLILAADGKQAEAVTVYQEIRRVLADELGVDPGPDLRSAYDEVLRHAVVPSSAGSQSGPDVAFLAAPRPAQLPPDPSFFTGRGQVLRMAREFLASPGEGSQSVPILGIDGLPGVGKTTLAVHLAHLAADSFADGVLYLDLRGFAAPGTAVGASEALAGFLSALGVPRDQVPASNQAQSGLYRSLLANRRTLVVLDNARDAEQIRPLLPSSPSCAVIFTSRSRLGSLNAVDGARLVTLDVPTLAEARDALIHRLGIERVVADPAAVEEIISRCGQLPLALAIVAARAGTHQELPLSEIAAELRSAHEGLDVFDDDEATGGVRTIFSWSYHLLTSQAARLFRLLPAHPGPGISVATAASLAGAPPREARQLIGELSRTRLLAEGRPGRYVLHDLVRAYARELHYDHEPSAERAAAGTRIAEHYRHTAYGAHLLLRPLVRLAPPLSPPPGVSPEKFDSEAQSLAWFASEHPAIRALIGRAARDGEHKLAWHLALYAQQFYQRDGRILEWAATLQVALDAVIEAKDRVGQAYVRRSLAGAYLFLNRTESARAELEQAGRLFDELGLAAEQAHIHDNLGRILYEQGNYREAGILAERARQSFRAAGNRKGEAAALLHLALCHAHEGHRDLAIDLLTQAVAEHREIGDPNGEGVSLDAMALTHRLFGDYPQALAYLQRAIEVYRRAGSSRANLVESLEALGDVYLAMGERGRAREAWEAMLAAVAHDRLPAAVRAHERLRSLEAMPSGT